MTHPVLMLPGPVHRGLTHRGLASGKSDPVRPFAAAAMMGVLLARGLASEAEVLPVLLEAALAAAPHRNGAGGRAGMRLRLVHALRDAEAAATRERAAATGAVARVAAALAALWASREQIEAAVESCAETPVRRHLLTRDEVGEITQRTMLGALARPRARRRAG